MTNKVTRIAAVWAVYGLLAFLALYNPIFHLDTSLPADPHLPVTDFYHFHWNYWWIRHALSSGLNVYETNYVLAPFTSSLALHTLTPFWYPLWALLEPLTGTVTAMTAVYLVALTLNGTVFFHFLRGEGVSVGWALAGGAILELSPILFMSIRWTNINLMGWFWLLLLMMTWRRVIESKTTARALAWTALLGLSVWAMVLTDVQYPLFAAFLVLPYGLLTLWQAPGRRARGRMALLVAVASALALLLLWFVGPLPYLLGYDRAGLAPTPAARAPKIEFPWCFVWHCDIGVPLGAIVLPGLLLALAINLRLRGQPVYRQMRRQRWFWLALTPVPLILSAGAEITIASVPITLPYVWLHTLLGGMFRYPERFGPLFMLPAVTFMLLTFTPMFSQRAARVGLPALLLLLVIADARLFEPTPLQPIPTRYRFYEMMGREPYDYVVVEAPTAGSSGEGLVGPQAAMMTQFYGTIHGKRMVNGHISRVNVWHYWWMRTDDALMAWLGQRRFLEPELVEAQLRERIFDWPIGYIVIHSDLIGRTGGPTLQEIIGYFNSLNDLLCPPLAEADAVVYRTRWHPDGCSPRTPPETQPALFAIDLGAPGDEAFIGWGWHWPEAIFDISLRWTGEYPRAQLYLDLPPGHYQLTLAAQAFWEPRALRLLANGQPLGDPQLVSVDSLQALTFDLPAAAVGDGQHLNLTLDYDAVIVPAEVGQSSDPRRLAVAVDYIHFRRLP